MPKELIAEMKAGYRGSNLSEEEVNHRVYGYLTKKGMLEDEGKGKSRARSQSRRKARVRKYLLHEQKV